MTIQVYQTIAALQAHLAPLRALGKIAFVPTMGALHAGHLALMQQAVDLAHHVVVSIFVNPAQFAPTEDFNAYPRNLADDVQKIADLNLKNISVFAPDVSEIYPDHAQDAAPPIILGEIAQRWEGEARPTHFAGVARVVHRLFAITQPDVAIFGEKDFQQLQVIHHLVRTLSLPIQVIVVEIVREATGLALSSRNIYLGEGQRNQIAPQLLKTLVAASAAIRGGGHPASVVAAARDKLMTTGFHQVDYIAYVDSQTLAPLAELSDQPSRLLVAAWLGKTRLIDNIKVT
ncbi:MAG TPA: pantoate--beta-alanine ligase [Rhodospirillaceae bacterium]|nr:pantoate--beta-alanine ligase [Rhodospirillaceae bacterium]